VISFVPPGAGTVSLCMTLIVSPKATWLKQLGVVGDWPMAGLPKTLHLDGAAEFKSKALKRGCGCSLHAQGHPMRARALEATSGATWRPLQPLMGSATCSQFMRTNFTAFAEYACKDRGSVPKYNWQVGASKSPERRVTLGSAPRRWLADHSFKFADHSFFDTYGSNSRCPGRQTRARRNVRVRFEADRC